jgi:putative heme-binding domain-containing protein
VINAARLTSQGDPRMPRSEKNAQGFMTSACGVTVYRGDAYPPEFRQQVLLAEVAGNLIHRQKIEPTGVTFTSQRIDEASEFLTSTDNWFRPVNFLHAPDGTLYVLDMYRETIEHPWSMPDDLKAMLDLESGRDRGRIYRLTPPGFQRRRTPRLSQATTAELVALLEHPNAWHRETAHRLLYERQPADAVEPLRTLITQSASEIGRLHAMWTLEGFGQLSDDDLIARMRDSSASVREHALALAEIHAAMQESQPSRETLLSAMLQLATDDAPRVRFQLALSLGQFEDARCTDALVTILRRDAADSWTVNAALSSSRELAPKLLEQLLQEPEFAGKEQHLPLLRQLATVTGVRKNPTELHRVSRSLESLAKNESLRAVITELLLAMDDGLRRAGTRLSVVWKDESAKSVLKDQIDSAITLVQSNEQTLEQRLVALRMLSCGDLITVRSAVTPLLTTAQPSEIQTSAVRALAAFQDDQTANELLSVFSASTPSVQYEVIEAMANHPQRIPFLLDAISDGRIAAAQVTPIRRTLLLNHADESIRQRARSLLGADRTTPRQEVIEQFQDAIRMPGAADKGKVVFVRECAACHRVGNSGFEIGPSLITVRHRTAAELLTQILDPNREVGPSYMQFAVALNNGQVLAGMIAEESPTSLTLKQAQNKQDVILRDSIAEIKATGLSLMPEGFEKKLTAQEMADLIAFLRVGTE